MQQQQRRAQHPETAETLHDFTRWHEQQKQTDQAFALYQQALAIREQRLGPQHPSTLQTRTCYAHFLGACGRSEEATAWEAVPTEQTPTTDHQPS